MFNDILKHRSGRVIALARAVLATVFLLAIWVDPTQPAQAAPATYAMLGVYVAVAIALAAITWNNWWLDAKTAAPAHVLDIAMFMLLVMATDGYTSPFFVFFVFLLLSAAIRWGWQQTALTAVAVTMIFFSVGITTANFGESEFDLQRFIIRSGNLVILSALLIWFGVNHGVFASAPRDEMLDDTEPGDQPLETAVESAAAMAGAASALLLWQEADSSTLHAVIMANGETRLTVVGDAPDKLVEPPFLFDLKHNRALCRGQHRRLKFPAASELLDRNIARRFGIDQGLALPIRTDAGRGMLLLGQIDGLCTDHIELGANLGAAVARHIQRHALLAAVEQGAVARARLSLARDLHDSIVQFLAGATFRVEAIGRALRSGLKADREIGDLKLLLLQEQQELRSAIGALRSERIPLPTLAADLGALCSRLARQWDVRCNFSSDVPEATAPMRLHLDTHQLVREAVANAVRHANAKSIDVLLSVEDSDLRLDIGNDGSGSEALADGQPWSLRERVDEADGTLMLATRSTGTSVSITLPLKGERRP